MTQVTFADLEPSELDRSATYVQTTGGWKWFRCKQSFELVQLKFRYGGLVEVEAADDDDGRVFVNPMQVVAVRAVPR